MTALTRKGREALGIEIEEGHNHAYSPTNIQKIKIDKKTLIIVTTKFSLAQSKIARTWRKLGARYISLPAFSPIDFVRPSLNVDTDHSERVCQSLAARIQNAETFFMKSGSGLSFSTSLKEVQVNSHGGFLSFPGQIASPPDLEVNFIPDLTSTNGRFCVNGSILDGTIGLVRKPISFDVIKGVIVGFQGEDYRVTRRLEAILNSKDRTTIGEIGFGMNPRAQLSGHMLEDEGSWGHVHIGLGSNLALGGRVDVKFHLDLVLRPNSCALKTGKREEPIW
jgi:leucyl aminopeptidase (aminopeptidase T)